MYISTTAHFSMSNRASQASHPRVMQNLQLNVYVLYAGVQWLNVYYKV